MESLSNLTADQLNEAIDRRNFPRPATASLNASVDHGDSDVEGSEERVRKDSRAMSEGGEGRHTNGYKWPNRPRPLDLNGVEKIFNVPGSSQTPRTSTTPGKQN